MFVLPSVYRIVFSRSYQQKVRSFFRVTVCAVLASALSSPLYAANTVVRMEITYGANQGIVDIELYDDEAPITVANFLRYAGRGYYDSSIFHRSVPGFIIQGGGHVCLPNPFTGLGCFQVPADPPIQNEFSLSRSNVRGTIAMAKVGGNPDSATSEWFFNLSNTNAANLDNQNGGFTVFGRVLDNGPGTGMAVVDAIAALPIFDGANNHPFYYPCNPNPSTRQCTNLTYLLELPTVNYDPTSYVNSDPTTYLQASNLVAITRIPNVASALTDLGTWATFTTDVDMTFDDVTPVPAFIAVSLLASFSLPPSQFVWFNNGMFALQMSGPMGPAGRVVTLHDGATTRPTHYYAYGKTPDNPTDHWYDFAYDSATGTGAEIVGDKILLHFVDGQRGDEDLDPNNNSITHAGAQVVLGPPPPTPVQSDVGGGCSITTNNSSQMLRGGDWLLVSLFLAMLALVRKRTRGDRDQNVISD